MKKNNKNIEVDCLSSIDKIIECGDDCLEKDTFDGCLSALDFYIDAQEKLDKLAKNDPINTDIKFKNIKLTNKISEANQKMSNPKLA